MAVALRAPEGRGAVAFLVADDAAVGKNKNGSEVLFVDVPLARPIWFDAEGGEEAPSAKAHSAKIAPKLPRAAAPNGGVGGGGEHIDHLLVVREVNTTNFARPFKLVREGPGHVRMIGNLAVVHGAAKVQG